MKAQLHEAQRRADFWRGEAQGAAGGRAGAAAALGAPLGTPLGIGAPPMFSGAIAATAVMPPSPLATPLSATLSTPPMLRR